jgi:uncharacterized coiled-coil DUF342 family protein
MPDPQNKQGEDQITLEAIGGLLDERLEPIRTNLNELSRRYDELSNQYRELSDRVHSNHVQLRDDLNSRYEELTKQYRDLSDRVDHNNLGTRNAIQVLREAGGFSGFRKFQGSEPLYLQTIPDPDEYETVGFPEVMITDD